ncbi:hypothetical protein LTR09_009585 [Extremus antarcticus]|uniref:Uncharacterized protein n=1 Tax=Extremus antarcticus TaxID=702011 RepID=A0AAJ0G5L5_9PEZI|nr:hypothetical protein LTR09_009585 [Extremus antarcticus]
MENPYFNPFPDLSNQSQFDKYLTEGKLLEVAKDGIEILLPDSPQAAIGTQDLKQRTCIVILGTGAIIMAHVSPLPDDVEFWADQSEENALKFLRESRDHFRVYLNRITDLVNQFPAHFGRSTPAFGFFSRDTQVRAPENASTQIKEHLMLMGCKVQRFIYKESNQRPVGVAKGECVAIAGINGERPRLYLEDEQISPNPRDVGRTTLPSSATMPPTQAPPPLANAQVRGSQRLSLSDFVVQPPTFALQRPTPPPGQSPTSEEDITKRGRTQNTTLPPSSSSSHQRGSSVPPSSLSSQQPSRSTPPPPPAQAQQTQPPAAPHEPTTLLPGVITMPQAYWTFSAAQQRWDRVVSGTGPLPRSQWTKTSMKAWVFCTDDRAWKMYDFDEKVWV